MNKTTNLKIVFLKLVNLTWKTVNNVYMKANMPNFDELNSLQSKDNIVFVTITCIAIHACCSFSSNYQFVWC